MSPEDICAVFERLSPQANEHDGLAHHVRPYFVAWTKLLARGNGVFQAAIASFFCLANSSGGAFALRFVLRNKVDIASSHALQRSKVFIAVRFPCVLALHGNPFSVIRAHYPPPSASALRPGGRLCYENMPPKRCYLIFGRTVLRHERPRLPAPLKVSLGFKCVGFAKGRSCQPKSLANDDAALYSLLIEILSQ